MNRLLASAALALALACGSATTGRDGGADGPSDGGVLDAGSVDARAGEEDAARCNVVPDASDCRDGLCRIPAGSFVMGSPRDEPFAAAVADIQVPVQLTHEFWIGQAEVTLADWRASGLPQPTPDWRRTGSRTADTPPSGYSSCTEPSCPVVWINFEDALAYANERSKQEGLPPCYALSDCTSEPGRFLRCATIRVNAPTPYECLGYRLPTEAEWEYAARAGSTTAFSSGDIAADFEATIRCDLDPNLDQVGWYCANANLTGDYVNGGGHPYPAMLKCANAWGLHDTAGNVFEWVNDLYDPLGYGEGPHVDPVFGVSDLRDLAPEHPVYGPEGKDDDGYVLFRSIRSGAFDMYANSARAGARLGNSVGGQHSGFRIARTQP